MRKTLPLALAMAGVFAGLVACGFAATPSLPTDLSPDLVVAPDGSGNFTTLQAALDSIPKDNAERKIILLRNGVYAEHVRLEASNVTLVGEDRFKTRIVWEVNDPRYRGNTDGNADHKGIATLNLVNANDVVIENLTIDNPANLGGKPFVVFSSGQGTRVVIQNAEILGRGGDSFSLWTRGLYYHRDLHVTGTYHFVGPRGTCYMSDSVIEVLGSADNALFNEGMEDERQRFVLQRCQIVSKVPFGLGSHFRDAAWYFIDCQFPETLKPTGKIFIAQSNPQKPQPVSAMFKWATDRVYFANIKGPDYPWLKDNIAQSPAKTASAVTAAWTFSNQWDPENTAAPKATRVTRNGETLSVLFDEPITVKGHPTLKLIDGKIAEYQSGSGTETLIFHASSTGDSTSARLQLNGGALLASRASAQLRRVPEGLELSR